MNELIKVHCMYFSKLRQSCGGSPVVVKPGTVILLYLIDCVYVCVRLYVYLRSLSVFNEYIWCMIRYQDLLISC